MRKSILFIWAFLITSAFTLSLQGQITLNIANDSDSLSLSGASYDVRVGTAGWSRWGDSSGSQTATGSFGYSFLDFDGNGAGSGTGTIEIFYNSSSVTGVHMFFDDSIKGLAGMSDLTFTSPSIALTNWSGSFVGDFLFSDQANGSVSGFGEAMTVSVSAIPEPSTYAAILGGLALLGFGLRRRFKQKKSLV